MLTWKMQMSITLLITHAFVNFSAVHEQASEIYKFELYLAFGIVECIV